MNIVITIPNVITFKLKNLFILYLVFFVVLFLYSRIKLYRIYAKIENLKNNSLTITPEELFKLKKERVLGEKKSIASQWNFSGVYILYNETKNMYYVGQSVKVFDRVNQHFTGKGNGDVYADYKYGDKFEISLIGLTESGFDNLNELERYAIKKYDAYANGYNKTKGNYT